MYIVLNSNCYRKNNLQIFQVAEMFSGQVLLFFCFFFQMVVIKIEAEAKAKQTKQTKQLSSTFFKPLQHNLMAEVH